MSETLISIKGLDGNGELTLAVYSSDVIIELSWHKSDYINLESREAVDNLIKALKKARRYLIDKESK